MFKSTLFTSFVLALSVFSRFAVAAPPACILACVNEAQNVTDIKAICANADAQSCLASKCGDNFDAASKFFKSTCQGAGHQVEEIKSSSVSSSSSPNKTASSSKNASANSTQTSLSDKANSTASPTKTGSSGSAATSSKGSGSSGSGAANQANLAFGSTLALVGVMVGAFAL